MKVERKTYAGFLIMHRSDYERVHGLIEAYGGRVKDCQYNWNAEKMIIFYEMVKSQKEEFEQELGEKTK